MNRQSKAILAVVAIVMLLGIMLAFSNVHLSQSASFVQTSSSGIVVTAAPNGYIIANVPKVYQFNYTLNGSVFKPYVSYINLNSAGLGLNYSFYTMHLMQPVLVRNTTSYGFYAELINESYYTSPQTVTIYVYSVRYVSTLNSSTPVTANTSTILPTTLPPPTTTAEVVGATSTHMMEIPEPVEVGSIAAVLVIIIILVAVFYYATRKQGKGKQNKKNQSIKQN